MLPLRCCPAQHGFLGIIQFDVQPFLCLGRYLRRLLGCFLFFWNGSTLSLGPHLFIQRLDQGFVLVRPLIRTLLNIGKIFIKCVQTLE